MTVLPNPPHYDESASPRATRVPGRRSLAVALLVLAIAVLSVGCAAQPDPRAGLDDALIGVMGDMTGPIHYFSGTADLDGDQQPELLVYVAGPMVCGTGGCNTLVFDRRNDELRLVAEISVTRPPIVAADTSTNGWRDLIVHVSGGGIIPGYEARLRFDGETYSANPTVEPAEPVRGGVGGEVVIAEFTSFRDGTMLLPAPE